MIRKLIFIICLLLFKVSLAVSQISGTFVKDSIYSTWDGNDFTGTNIVYSASHDGGGSLPSWAAFDFDNQGDFSSWSDSVWITVTEYMGIDSTYEFEVVGSYGSLNLWTDTVFVALAGGIPTEAEDAIANLPTLPDQWYQDGLNWAITTMADSGEWEHMKDFHIFFDEHEDNARTSLVDGVTGVFEGTTSPTHVPFEATIGSGDGLLRTDFNPSLAGMPLDTATYGVKVKFPNTQLASATTGGISVYMGNLNVRIRDNIESDDMLVLIHSAGNTNISDRLPANNELLVGARTAATEQHFYSGSTLLLTDLDASTSVVSDTIAFFGERTVGTNQGFVTASLLYGFAADTAGLDLVTIEFVMDSLYQYVLANRPADASAPSAAVIDTTYSVNESSITFGWDSGADNYAVMETLIFRNGIKIDSVNYPRRIYTATGLAAGTAFDFTVFEKDLAGNLSLVSNTWNESTSGGAEPEFANFIEDFESHIPIDDPSSQPYNLSGSNDATVSVTHAKSGTKSIRSLIPFSPIVSDPRSEIRHKGGTGSPTTVGSTHAPFTTRTFLFSYFFASDFENFDPVEDHIFQWKNVADPGGAACDIGSPAFALRLQNNTIKYNLKFSENPCTAVGGATTVFGNITTDIALNSWHNFVVQIHYDYRETGGNGSVKVWYSVGDDAVESDLVVDYAGAVGYNDQVGAYAKHGFYKGTAWQSQSTADRLLSSNAGVTQREMWIDDTGIIEGEWIGSPPPVTPPVDTIQYVLNETFDTWINVPDPDDHPSAGTLAGQDVNSFFENVGGAARLTTDGDNVTLTYDGVLDPTKNYYARIQIADGSGGNIRINAIGGTTETVFIGGSVVDTLLVFPANGNTGIQVKRSVGVVDVTISDLKVWESEYSREAVAQHLKFDTPDDIFLQASAGLIDSLHISGDLAKTYYLLTMADSIDNASSDWINDQAITLSANGSPPDHVPYTEWDSNSGTDEFIDTNFDLSVSYPSADPANIGVGSFITQSTATPPAGGTGNRVFGAGGGSSMFLNDQTGHVSGSGTVQYRIGASSSANAPDIYLRPDTLYHLAFNGTNQSLHKAGVQFHTEVDPATGILMADQFNWFNDGGATPTQGWAGAASHLIVADRDANWAYIHDQFGLFNERMKHSKQGQIYMARLGIDAVGTDQWFQDSFTLLIDTLHSSGELAKATKIYDFKTLNEEMALTEWQTGAVATKVGTPVFSQYAGFITDGDDAINTGVQTNSQDDATFIWQGDNLTTLVQSWMYGGHGVSNSILTGLRVDTDVTDEFPNWAYKINSNIFSGNWFPKDTLFVATKRMSDTLRIYKGDSLANTKAGRASQGVNLADIYVGGLNANNVFEVGTGAVGTHEIYIEGDSTMNLSIWSFAFARFHETIRQNTGQPGNPDPDTTPPSVPVIAHLGTSTNFLSVTITVPSVDTESGMDHYNLYQDDALVGTTAAVSSTASFNNLTPNTFYDMELSGVDVAGNESARSNLVREKTDNTGGQAGVYFDDFENNACIGCPSADAWGEFVLEGGNYNTPTFNSKPKVVVDPDDGGNNVMQAYQERVTLGWHLETGGTVNANKRSEPTWRPDKYMNVNDQTFPEWNNFIPFFTEFSHQFRIKFAADHDFTPNFGLTINQLKPPQGGAYGNPNFNIKLQTNATGFSGHVRAQPDANEALTGDYDDIVNTFFSHTVPGGVQKGVWYHFIIDYTNDYRTNAQGGSGMTKVYMKAGAWPAVGDLIMEHNESNVFNTTLYGGAGGYVKNGSYLFVWSKEANIIADSLSGVDRIRWFYDDVTLQEGHEFSFPWWAILLLAGGLFLNRRRK